MHGLDPWQTSSDRPAIDSSLFQGEGFIAGFIGIDTVGKTEFSLFLETLGFRYLKVGTPIKPMIDGDTPATAIMGGFMGGALTEIDRMNVSKQNIAMDPADAIQVLARLRAEGKLNNLDPRDIVWLEKQSELLLRECLKKGYRAISIHLKADHAITEKRLSGRIKDPGKVTSYDQWLHADPSRQRVVSQDIAKQIYELEQKFAHDPGVLFVQYDTSNASGYPTNFDTAELKEFLTYLSHYFGNHHLPSVVWSPYAGDHTGVKWSNDHMTQEVILTTDSLGASAEKKTNWSVPVFMKDGAWHCGFGVDIFDFSRSSGELRLKPWGGQAASGDLARRVTEKFRSGSAEIINTQTQPMLLQEQKIITPVWNSGGNKELTPYVTHLTEAQFRDIRSTPRYCQIVSMPIGEILQTVHAKPGTPDRYITYRDREYRLASGVLDMLLLFAREKGIIPVN